MKVADKRWFTVLLQWTITIAMTVGTIIVLTLPIVLSWVLHYYETDGSFDKNYYYTCLCFLYPSGILGLAILYHSRKLLVKVNEDEPFIFENANRIKYMARLSAVLCCIYAVAMFFIHSFFTVILFIVFGLIALFLSVLGELFYEAVEYKNDNDFTI